MIDKKEIINLGIKIVSGVVVIGIIQTTANVCKSQSTKLTKKVWNGLTNTFNKVKEA